MLLIFYSYEATVQLFYFGVADTVKPRLRGLGCGRLSKILLLCESPFAGLSESP